MAIAFGSLSNTGYANRTNTTITAPSGITNGDWLLMFLLIFDTTPPAATFPTGFNALTGSPLISASATFNLHARAKLASGEAGDYTVTHANCNTQGVILRYSGAAGTITVTPTKNTGTTADSTALAVTTTVANSMLVLFQSDNADTTNNLTPTAGFTERLDGVLSFAADSIQVGTGTSGDKVQTNNAGTGNPWLIWLVALDEAPVAGVPIWLVTA